MPELKIAQNYSLLIQKLFWSLAKDLIATVSPMNKNTLIIAFKEKFIFF